MKTIFVYGGNSWRNCVDMAQDIARILHQRRVRHITLYGTNAEVLTDRCRILVRTLNEKFYIGRAFDECFYYPTSFAERLVNDRAFVRHTSDLIEYIFARGACELVKVFAVGKCIKRKVIFTKIKIDI